MVTVNGKSQLFPAPPVVLSSLPVAPPRWDQIGRSLPQLSKKMTLDSGGYQAKDGAIYPFTAYQGAETLNIYIILICEAFQVGFEAHP